MLKPVVLQNLELLRQIRDWPGDLPPTTPDLAKALERDASNTRKSIKALIDEGLIAKAGDGHVLTADADRALQDLARSLGAPGADPAAGAAILEGMIALRHAQIFPDHLNPRTDWDSPDAQEQLDELAADIAANGLLQNLVVRPMDGDAADMVGIVDANGVRLPTYRLIAGERRWRSILKLIKAGTWPSDRLIPCRLSEGDDRQHALVALAENLKRRDLKPLEEARAFKALVSHHGVATEEIADFLKCSQRMVQQRLQLLDLPPEDQAKIEKGEMSLEQARTRIAHLNRLKLHLPPAQALLLVEIASKIERDPAKVSVAGLYGVKTEIGGDAGGEALDALRADHLVSIKIKASDGRSYAELGWGVKDRIVHTWPTFKGRTRPGLLMQLRLEALGPDAKTIETSFATPWLNGPFEPDQEAAAEHERQLAEQERRRQANEAAIERRRRQLTQAVEDGKVLVQDLLGREFSEADERLTPIIAGAGFPLPWHIDNHGQIWAANHQHICFSGHDETARLKGCLIVIAVNALGGHTTNASGPQAPDVDEEDEGDLTDEEAALISAEMRADREAFAAELAEA